MARPGPRPKPSALKRLEGTYRPDRAAPAEVQAPAGVPEPPIPLDAESMKAWAILTGHLQLLGLLSTVDGHTLAGLCRAVSKAVAADAILAAEGLLTVNRFGDKVEHPAVSISRQAWADVRAFGTEFGLSPASRTRIGAAPKTKTDDAESFFFGGLSVVNGDVKS
jgi:P27 family predicted phage terminase small subunit